MFWLKCQSLTNVFIPFFLCLSRETVHQIYTDITDSCGPQSFCCTRHLVRRVPALKEVIKMIAQAKELDPRMTY